MEKKWKEFSAITGLSAASVIGETAWTGFLVSATSKIPYVGIPIAVALGLTGIFGAVWMGNACGFAYKDWYKEYYNK